MIILIVNKDIHPPFIIKVLLKFFTNFTKKLIGSIMNNLCKVLLTVIISSINLIAQQVPSFISDSLDNYVNRALENWKIPGAAVLVVKDGDIHVSRGYGVKEFGTKEEVDENTLFMIGSNTKAFTGTLLALLEHEGKFRLEDKVIKFLPDFKMRDPWITKELNLIDIVSHRMGLETFQGDFMYWSSDLTEDDVIEKFGKIKPLFDFRTRYGYTNAGYTIAGKVIQSVSGLRWEDYLKEKILIPLQMNRTTALSVEYSKAENISKPHSIVEGKIAVLPFENIDNLAPCGSMGSSVSDLANWVIAVLDSGRLNERDIIPSKVIQRTIQQQTIVRRATHPFNKTNYSLYGLGWALQDYEGREIVSHTGGVNGFVTSVTLLPKEKLGIVVLTNTDQNGFYNTLKWEIIDAYLDLPFRNYDSFSFERVRKQNEQNEKQIAEWRDSVKTNIKPEPRLSDFVGKYEHEVYGYAELKKVGAALELTLEHHSKVKGKLEYIGNNRFLCTYSDPLYGIKVFPFKIEDNKVISFDLYVDDFLEFLPYKFVKK